MSKRSRPTHFSIAFCLCLAASSASLSAQDIQIHASPGPYYAGDPVVVQVVVRDKKPNAGIECRFDGKPSNGMTIQGPQLSQSSRSFTQIINGRISRHESVDYIFNFVVTVDRVGACKIGPFVVSIAGQKHRVPAKSFQFEKLKNDPDMRVSVSLPGDTFYVGQRVLATVRWSFAGDMNAVQYAFSNLQIRSPLFDQFAFAKNSPRTRTTLTIAMAKGSMDIDADVSHETIDGREFITVTGKTTFIADTPGEYHNLPVTCRTDRVAHWQRDLFGGLVPRGRRPALAAGKPLNFVIKPIPTSGRPASFAGAVGRGFSIAVSANRSIVRVGDPIVLTITLHGDGDMSRISLPPLSASPAWSAASFQLPDTPPSGTVADNSKQFTLNIRVTDTHVTKIPAVAFSWFDPAQGKFETATSKPIALQVMENQVISAADVVSAATPANASGTAATDKHSRRTGAAGSASRGFIGADLAIERDLAKLLRRAPSKVTLWGMTIGLYILAAGILLVGVVLRRRGQRDMNLVRRKKRRRELEQRINAAQSLSPRDAAVEIAKALRELIAELTPTNREEFDQLIAQCDTIIYAHNDSESVELEPIVAQARRLVRDIPET